MVSVRVIEYGSKDYELELKLRSKILREPLGLRLTEAELAQDVGDFHLGAFSENGLVGCLLLKPLSKEVVKMRQVAVDSNHQGQGIGRQLVEHGERVARESGYQEIILNARDAAVPFYQSLGYLIEGERFEELGIPHFKMKKTISEGV